MLLYPYLLLYEFFSINFYFFKLEFIDYVIYILISQKKIDSAAILLNGNKPFSEKNTKVYKKFRILLTKKYFIDIYINHIIYIIAIIFLFFSKKIFSSGYSLIHNFFFKFWKYVYINIKKNKFINIIVNQ